MDIKETEIIKALKKTLNHQTAVCLSEKHKEGIVRSFRKKLRSIEDGIN